MRKMIVVLLFCLAPVVFAADFFAETLTLNSGSAVNAAKAYSNKQISLDCGGEIAYRVCPTSTCTAVVTDATISNFDLPVDICLPFGANYISVIRTGASNITCTLSEVNPVTSACK